MVGENITSFLQDVFEQQQQQQQDDEKFETFTGWRDPLQQQQKGIRLVSEIGPGEVSSYFYYYDNNNNNTRKM